MALRRIGKLRRSTVVAGAALVVTASAFAIALTAAADSQGSGRELSGRLLPAAAAADKMLGLFAAQQDTLRVTVTNGTVSGLGHFRTEGAQFRAAQARAVLAAGGDQPMRARLDGLTAAYRAWLDRFAGPQVAAVGRGDFAAARALRAHAQHSQVAALAVHSTGLALQADISGEQQAVIGRLERLYWVQLGALIVMLAVVAVVAVVIVVDVRQALLRPFRQLNRAVAEVANGSYATRIPAVGYAELTELSHDIELMRTRLVEAIEERERAQESARSLFDLAPDAMFAANADGTIMLANAQAAQLYGYRIGDLIGRQVKMLLPEPWRTTLEAEATRHLGDRRSRRPSGREIMSVGLRQDGSTFPSEVRLSLLPSSQGTLIVSAVRDLTERLAMEAERERLRAAAEQQRLQQRLQQSRRLESLGQLVGGVAHDFNNLLNVIAGYADFTAEQLTVLAAEDDRIGPVLADVEQVRTAAQQAIRVTRQLLTFARSEAAKREVLDVNEVVESAAQLLRRSIGERIELVVSVQPDLWPVEADRGQLEQVLMNVALNARDAMPGGGRLTIETGNAEVDPAYAAQRPSLKPGRYCRLAVSDTGTGMDAATIERVFEPFFSTKPRGRGTGLGLATVYGIVTGLGGTIDIYSEKGLGTTVSVLLPVTEQVAEDEAQTDPPEEDLRGHGEAILLVEDEESLRTMASRILTGKGYRVFAARDGADAVRLAADPDQPVDLLLTDMVMPQMLGIEVVHRVRAARPRLAALFISGYAQHVLDFHGIPAADHDILQKPFTEAALLSRVRRALNRSAASIVT